MLLTFLLFVALKLSASSPLQHPEEETDSIFNRPPSVGSVDAGWLFGIFSPGGTVSVVDRQPPVSYDARPAGFGPRIEDGLLGYVIPLSSFTTKCPIENGTFPLPILVIEEDYDMTRGAFAAIGTDNIGCEKLCVSGPHKPEKSETWIALVQRGECSFVEKVKEAQRLGASGVVVGGSDEEMITMFSPDEAPGITIPSHYIQRSSYLDLMGHIQASNTSTSGLRTVSILMTVDYGAWEWYSPLLTFALLLLLPSILTLATLIIHRFRTARARRLERAPQDIVSQLPWRVWGAEGWEKWTRDSSPPPQHQTPPQPATEQTPSCETAPSPESNVEGCCSSQNKPPGSSDPSQGAPLPPWFRNQTECSICLSDFANGDRVRILPCNHIFHLEEVDEWLIQRKKLCPVCKRDVTKPIEESGTVTGEQEEAGEGLDRTSRPAAPTSVPTETTPLLGS